MWFPEYKSKSGRPDQISGIRITECPTSYITDQSRWLLEQIGPERSMKEEYGASMFGAESGKWPGWWFDAVAVIASAVAQVKEIEAGK